VGECIVRAFDGDLGRGRYPAIGRVGAQGFAVERCGRNACDGERFAFEQHRGADDRRVASEEIAPGVIAEDHARRRSRRVLSAVEEASDGGPDAEQIEVVRRDVFDSQRTGGSRASRAASAHGFGPGCECRHVSYFGRVGADGFVEIPREESELAGRLIAGDEAAIIAFAQAIELARPRNGQAVVHDLLHQREHGRVDADAERQRENRRDAYGFV